MKSNLISILLVEDDALDVKSLQRAFLENNLPAITHVAENGIDALHMLRAKGENALSPAPNIILIDIRMPEMDGLSFLQELRRDEHLKGSIVYVITTSDEEKHILEAHNLNVAGYILKPLQYSEFVETVKNLKEFWKLIELPESKQYYSG